MKQILTITISLFALFNINCGNTKEITEIKPKVIYPPVIEDTVRTSIVNDTIVIGTSVESGPAYGTGVHAPPLKTDTMIIIKYFPKLEKFYVKVKPDSIIIFDTVKTTQTIEKNIETPLLSKIGLVMIGIIITIIGSFLLGKRG